MYKPTLHSLKTNNITADILASEHKRLLALYQASGDKEATSTKYFDANLYELSANAKLAADILSGSDERLTFGPFCSARITLPTIGDIVSIPKGATIYSTHPDPDRKTTIAKRTRNITLSSVRCGYYNNYSLQVGFVSTQIQWAGTGGYWHWINLDDNTDFWQQQNNQKYITGPICETCGQETC